jgi:hypothetical protein
VADATDAVQELYQAPLAQFVAERKRLAADLKKAGDAGAAKDLLARKRPTMSAWVVNQLYWHARDAFDDMLETAARLRKGNLEASGAHREAIATLRKRATAILTDAGHKPTEATLRRVTTTLAALAATGGFDPDPPGALAEDRDPPGFEAIGIPTGAIESTEEDDDEGEDEDEKPASRAHNRDGHERDGHGKDELAAARAKAEAQREREREEKRKAEQQRKQRAAERHRLEAALRTAKGDVTVRQREVKQLEKQLEAAQARVDKAQSLVDDLESKLADLADA